MDIDEGIKEVLFEAYQWCVQDAENLDGYPTQAMFEARVERLKEVIDKITGVKK